MSLHGKKRLGKKYRKGWHHDKILVHLKKFTPYSPNTKYWTFEVEKYGPIFCLWFNTNTYLFMNFFELFYRDSIYDKLKKY